MLHLKKGDFVTRTAHGGFQTILKVDRVTKDRIHAGVFEFDRLTGAEIDEDWDWGPPPKITGSYLRRAA